MAYAPIFCRSRYSLTSRTVQRENLSLKGSLETSTSEAGSLLVSVEETHTHTRDQVVELEEA